MNLSSDGTHDGIVLRVFPSRDADLIARVLTTQLGKVAAVAKFARKSSRRFASGIDIFDRGVFELSNTGRSSLMTLQSFTARSPYSQLRNSLDSVVLASVLCEAFDHLVPEQGQHEQFAFPLLDGTLRALDSSRERIASLRIVYSCLAALLVKSGFLAAEAVAAPSAHQLMVLLDAIEWHAERPLLSRPQVTELLLALRGSKQTA